MTEVIIYSTPVCPYCVRAKNLLKNKGVSWQEINVAGDEALRDAMIEKAGGRRTVPQILINGTHVGGYDDLYALDQSGKLDAMLK
jgi:glutaredoxin 3